MKKISIVIAIVLLTAASFLLSFANGSGNTADSQNVQQEKSKSETPSCCAEETKVEKQKEEASCCSGEMESMSDGNFSESSIYQVNSNWKNQFGNGINIGDLKGKTQVFAMIFANCTYACPIIANDMRKIEQSLSKEELQNVQFTLVSIDPERDTPERLKKFASDQELNLGRWQLLTGERNDIDDLAALTGFRYKKENDGSFSHSNIITILNKDGEIIHQQVGLNQDITKTVKIVKNQNQKGV